MNHTSLALIAFLLAAMLVISATIAAAAPALGAGGGHSKRSGHGTDRQSNKAETTASGEGSTAITLQGNAATNGLLGYASTFINQKNKAKTTASGEGSTAITFQANEAKGSGHGHSNDQNNKAKTTTASGEGSTALTLQRNAVGKSL